MIVESQFPIEGIDDNEIRYTVLIFRIMGFQLHEHFGQSYTKSFM